MVKWLAQAGELMGKRQALNVMSLQSSPKCEVSAIPFDRSQTYSMFCAPPSQSLMDILK